MCYEPVAIAIRPAHPHRSRCPLAHPASPASIRRDGRVNVEVEVDANGCALRATVVVSSGDADIDNAALDLALLGGAYLPGSGDSGATGGAIRFWVQFDMLDPE